MPSVTRPEDKKSSDKVYRVWSMIEFDSEASVTSIKGEQGRTIGLPKAIHSSAQLITGSFS